MADIMGAEHDGLFLNIILDHSQRRNWTHSQHPYGVFIVIVHEKYNSTCFKHTLLRHEHKVRSGTERVPTAASAGAGCGCGVPLLHVFLEEKGGGNRDQSSVTTPFKHIHSLFLTNQCFPYWCDLGSKFKAHYEEFQLR